MSLPSTLIHHPRCPAAGPSGRGTCGHTTAPARPQLLRAGAWRPREPAVTPSTTPRASRQPGGSGSSGGRGGRGGGGSGSRSGPRSGRGSSQQQKRKTAPEAPVTPVIEEGPVEVPALGWMWQAGTSSSSSSNGDAASRAMPTAAATVANLYEDRIKAKKSLGQNFMMDDTILRDIVAAAGVGPGDLVLEVGPGTGNLTKHLLAAGARVTAVEKDDTLYARLGQEYAHVPELELVNGDAVKVGLEDIIRHMVDQDLRAQQQGQEQQPAKEQQAQAASSPSPSSSATDAAATPAAAASSPAAAAKPKRVKVVANLPYNITKDLLQLLLPLGDCVSDLHIMIQHEAGERLTERTPGGREWRAANIRTLFYCRPKYRFRISRFKYDPVPGVDGALVTFALRPPAARPAVPSEQGLLELVDKAFSERRKKMRNSLTPLYSSQEVEAALAACGLNVDARAQDLTLEQFVALSWQLHRQRVDTLLVKGNGPAAPGAEAAPGPAVGKAAAGGRGSSSKVGLERSKAVAVEDVQDD